MDKSNSKRPLCGRISNKHFDILYKIGLVIFVIILLFGILASTLPDVLRTARGEQANTMYPNIQGPMSGIVSIVCDMNDNLYVMSDHSECLIAFSPEGEPLFTYCFKVVTNGSSSMMSKKDNTVVVDYNGDSSNLLFSKREAHKNTDL